MNALIESRKGVPQPIVHTFPKVCRTAQALSNPTGASDRTVRNGFRLGWFECAWCGRIGDLSEADDRR